MLCPVLDECTSTTFDLQKIRKPFLSQICTRYWLRLSNQLCGLKAVSQFCVNIHVRNSLKRAYLSTAKSMLNTHLSYPPSQFWFYLCSNLKPLLDTLGLYFQIRDDYANLYSEEVSSLCTVWKIVSRQAVRVRHFISKIALKIWWSV